MSQNEEIKKCPNCGAPIEDNSNATIICTYCNTRISVSDTDAKNEDLFIASAKIDRTSLSKYVAKWITDPGYYQPETVDLRKITVTSAKMYYYPAYFVSGSYRGDWKRAGSANWEGTVRGKFAVLGYAATNNSIIEGGGSEKAVNNMLMNDPDMKDMATGDINQQLVKELIGKISIKNDDLQPFNQGTNTNSPVFEFGLTAEASWRMAGSKALDEEVLFEVRKQCTNNNLGDAYRQEFSKKYESFPQSTQKVYVPVWEVSYTLDDRVYWLALSGTNGQATGDKIAMRARPKMKTGWEQLLTPWVILPLWIAYGVLRSKEVPFFQAIKWQQGGGPLMSDPLTTSWWIRQAVVFLGSWFLLPVLRNKIVKDRTFKVDDPKDNDAFISGAKTLTFA